MKITDVHVDGFGVWSGVKLSRLDDHLTVFHGQNEAGKTTLLQFIRAVLYGLHPRQRKRYLPSVHGQSASGSLDVQVSEGAFQILRYFDDDLEPGSDLVVISSDGKEFGARRLKSFLDGVDETTFHNIFALGLGEIQYFGTLGATDAAKQLYSLAAGTDRVALLDVMGYLQKARQELLVNGTANEPSQIEILWKKRHKLGRELGSMSARSADWPGLVEESRSLTEELAGLDQRREQLMQKKSLVELAASLRPKWLEIKQLDNQLHQLGPIPEVTDDHLQQLDKLRREISTRRRQRADLEQEINKVEERLSHCGENNELHDLPVRIDALLNQREWICAFEQESHTLASQLDDAELQILTHQEHLGISTASATIPMFSAHSITVLRNCAQQVSDSHCQHQSARSDTSEQRQRAEELSRRIQQSFQHYNVPDVVTALEYAGNQLSQLEKRIELRDELELIQRKIADSQQKSKHLLSRQLLPIRVLLSLGVVFAFGAMLVLVATFGHYWNIHNESRWLTALIGMGISFVAIVMKNVFEHSSNQQLQDVDSQIGDLKQREIRIRQQCDTIDEALPTSGGTWEARLRQASSELETLENLLPLDTQRRAYEEQCSSSQLFVERAGENLRSAQQCWAKDLQNAGLPGHLKHEDVEGIIRRMEQIGQLQSKLKSLRTKRESHQREGASIEKEIRDLLFTAGLSPSTKGLVANLQKLSAARNQLDEVGQHREQLRGQSIQLKRREKKLARRIGIRQKQLRKLAAQFGARNKKQLGLLLERLASAEHLRRRGETLKSEIASAVGVKVDEQNLATELERSCTENEQRLTDIDLELTALVEEMNAFHERRGEISQKMKMLASDPQLSKKKLDMDELNAKISERLHKWKVLALAEQTLRSVQMSYEMDRQPESLAEASYYLRNLTGGRYTRIWTPLGASELRVDNEKGDWLSLVKLSRGTREQVYLSLRLALVASYARRGVHLPMILDDVFVNFDVHRARAAAQVLQNFAQEGHQLLIFTCHDHICEIFESLGADVRQLPDAAEVAREASIRPVLRKPKRRHFPSLSSVAGSHDRVPASLDEQLFGISDGQPSDYVAESNDGRVLFETGDQETIICDDISNDMAETANKAPDFDNLLHLPSKDELEFTSESCGYGVADSVSNQPTTDEMVIFSQADEDEDLTVESEHISDRDDEEDAESDVDSDDESTEYEYEYEDEYEDDPSVESDSEDQWIELTADDGDSNLEVHEVNDTNVDNEKGETAESDEECWLEERDTNQGADAA